MPKPLTIPQVAALTADGVHWVSDSLYIRVRGTSKTWLFRYSKFRKATWRSLGPAEFKSLTAARAEVLRLRAAIHEGKEPDALRACPSITAPTGGRYPGERGLIV